ncbi:amidohydrolase [Deinococcus ruber]|uniref:Amidohydrolase n=1 Tax=Deinococcus ruber TaxID=1848197 RepID=A0A918CIG1_9DEIO|nr:amidohydrolase [Deinococcus ruber]GGR25598.1 amidohydrolase [Deinococcus ruber]
MSELLLHNAAFLTLNERQPHAEALLIRAGRVAAVGSLADVQAQAAPGSERRDLGGSVVTPGLNDAHIHVWKVGQLRTTSLDLRGLTDLPELYRRVAERAAALSPGDWLVGRGWNEALLGGEGPTRRGLDEVSPQNPVLLTRTCAHIHAVNSPALEAARITSGTPAPGGGEIQFAAGLLYETAFGLVTRAMPTPDAAQYERWISAGLTYLASLGLTSVTDPAVDPPLYAAYRALDARGELPIRVNLLYMRRPDGGADTYPLPEMYVSDRLRCDSVKFFTDGGLSGATAALAVPYRNTPEPTRGMLRFEDADLYALAEEAHVANWRIGAHAIGDRALDQLLKVYERLERTHPGGKRHRIEHFGLPDAEHLRRAADLGIHAVPQAIFLHELRGNFARYLPPDYWARTYPLRSMLDAGLNVALSSDGPVVREVRPLVGLQAAVQEPMVPGQQLTALEALRAYTLGGARAQGDHDNLGTLESGKWADLSVLSADPLTHARPGEIEVRASYVAGVETESKIGVSAS